MCGQDGTAVPVWRSPKPDGGPPRWFGDKADASTPFSLHNLVQRGQESGKKAGDWYGPSSVAYILKDALEDAAHRDQRLAQLCIYVAQDCTIYMDDVTALCTAGSTEGETRGRLPRTVFARREMFSGGQTQRRKHAVVYGIL